MPESIIAAARFLGAMPVDAPGGVADGILNWAFLFAATLLIELPMVMIAWRFRRCEGTLHTWLLASVIGNLVSHPSATFLATMLPAPADGLEGMAGYLALEMGSVAVEAWAFRLRATPSWTEAAVMALVANAVTALLGAYLVFVA